MHFRSLSIWLLFLGLVTVDAAAQLRRSTPRPLKTTVASTFFLTATGPKRQALACALRTQRPVIGTFTLTGDEVRIRPLNTTTSKNRAAIRKATKECAILVTSPACSNRRDDDGDGRTDFPSDPDCRSSSGTSEQQTTESLYALLSKPFEGTHAISSVFDHQFPLEFIHTDGEIIATDGELSVGGVDGHQGYDFHMDEGTPILAAYDGVVSFAGEESPFFCPLLGKNTSGLSVAITHTINGESYRTIYGHCSEIKAVAGAAVHTGDLLCLSGNTGCSTEPHLHFDLQRLPHETVTDSRSVDPYGWSGPGPDPWAIDPAGAVSIPMWRTDAAPEFFREIVLSPNPNSGDGSPIAITTFRYAGLNDSTNPNNEFIEIRIDERFTTSSSIDLTGYYLLNNAGERLNIPSGTLLRRGTPLLLYTGPGSSNSVSTHLGRTSGFWTNAGDCARLMTPNNFRTYYLFFGSLGCTGVG